MTDPLVVAAFTLDHLFKAWGWTFQQRLEWARQASEKYAWSQEFRLERKRYCDLFSPREQVDPDLFEQRTILLNLVHPYEASLSELGMQVHQVAEAGRLWVTESSLLRSIAHMHLNRLLGLDRTKENQAYTFWRHTLDSLERRPGENHTSDERKGAFQ